MYGRKPRTKQVAQVMAELDEIHRLGMSNVFVVDDNFIGNKKEAKSLLKAIAEWQAENRYPVEMMTEVTLNVAQDDELLDLMRQANFRTIFVGIESPRAASLQESKKTQNLREDILQAVHRIQRVGIEVMAGMIVGFDNDDVDIFDEQFRFIQDARIPVSMTGMLNAVPKTPLHERLSNAGRLLAESVGDQFIFTNIVPLGMSREQLIRRLWPPFLGAFTLTEITAGESWISSSGRGTLLYKSLMSGRKDLGIFGRFVWNCIVRASPRRAWFSLRLMVETVVRRPSAFRDAVSFALLHKHLYEYMSDTCAQLDGLVQELRNTPAQTHNHLKLPADAGL